MGASNWMDALPTHERMLAERGLFGAAAAAAYTGTSKRWIYDCIKQGSLPARKVGKRYIILQRDIDALLGS